MKTTLLRHSYSLLTMLSLPFAVLRLLWKSRRDKRYRQRLSERFAYQPPANSQSIWIHAVSVGEFLAVLPLVEKLLEEQHPLLITTTTPTGSAMVKQKLAKRVNHCYLPFDAPFLVQRFLRIVKPRLAVFVETEIWPNYLLQLQKSHINALLINARLSEKSYQGYRRLGALGQQVIAALTVAACQDSQSEKRFLKLGATATTLGNLKFDLSLPMNIAEKKTTLLQRLGTKPFILAASTHPDEEQQLLLQYQQSAYRHSHLFIIAPRHPERCESIITEAKPLGLMIKRYSDLSANNPLNNEDTIVIIDTLGELLYFYALAEFAIIGGSFVPHGGHNPLEAALFSTPCLIGEYYFNFESLIDEMIANHAIITTTVKAVFNPHHPKDLAIIGKRANTFLMSNQGATKHYKQLINQYL